MSEPRSRLPVLMLCLLALVAASSSLLVGRAPRAPAPPLSPLPAPGLDAAGPVRIVTGAPELPDWWAQHGIRVEASPVSPANGPWARGVAEAALRKYPAAVLEENLRAVYLLGDLRVHGDAWGGTFSGDAVYLRAEGWGVTETYLEESLHHEFSSVLLWRHPRALDRARWTALNPRGFGYTGSPERMAVDHSADLLAWDEQLARRGFVCRYATADLEQDFNCTAALLFAGSRRLWRAVDEGGPLAGKARLAVAFYQSLHPSLDESYFRSLSRPRRGAAATDD